MNRFSLIPAAIVIFILVAGLSTPALADPIIEVAPMTCEFGNVELGASSTAIVTASNLGGHPLVIFVIGLQAGSSPDFSITQMPSTPLWIDPPDWLTGEIRFIDIEITDSPSALVYVSTVLQIMSNDLDNGLVQVALSGTGVEAEPPPEEQIAEILDFFDNSVADGTLVGSGPAKSGDGRRKALRNMIEAAGDLIQEEETEEACQQLMDVYRRTDALPRPPDFVTGEAAIVLAGMIFDLRATLGCDPLPAPPRARTLSPTSKLAVTWGKLKAR